MPPQSRHDNSDIVANEREEAIYRHLTAAFPGNVCVSAVSSGEVNRRWVGEGFADVLGYEVAEIEEDLALCQRIVHPDDECRVRSAFARTLAGELTADEFRISCKDGEVRRVRETRVPGMNAQGVVVRTLSIVQDVTEKALPEEQLVHCRQILDESPTAVVIRDLSTRAIYCNVACSRIYGFASPEEMIGTTLSDIVPRELWKSFEADVLPRILSGPWSGEVTLSRRDGTHVEASISTNLLRGMDDRPVAIYAAVTDITERKRAERALSDSEELLKAVQNSLPAHLAVLDRKGSIIAVNELWERFAVENGDPTLAHTGVGVNYMDVCRQATGAFSEGAGEALEGLEALLSGSLREFELTYSCPLPDEDRWFSMRAKPLLSERGGLVVAHIDVTARVRAENELRRRNHQLEVLSGASQQVNAVLDIPVIIRNLILSGMELTEAQAGTSGLVVDGKTLFTEYIEQGQVRSLAIALGPGQGVPGCVMTSRKPYLTNDAQHDPHVIPEIREALGFYNLVDVPILSRKGELLGCFELHNKKDHRPFDEWDVAMLEGLAAAAAIALDNANILDERKRTEAELRESERKLRSLIDSVDAIIFRMSAEYEMIAMAGSPYRMLGYTAAELISQPRLWREQIRSDDLEQLFAVADGSAAAGMPVSVEFRTEARSGEMRWLRAHVTPTFDESCNLLYFDGVALDITGQVEAQQRERRHMDRMSALADISQAFASSLHFDGIVEAAVRRIGTALGCVCTAISIDPDTSRLSQLAISSDHPETVARVEAALEATQFTVDTAFGGREGICPRIERDMNELSPELACFAQMAGIAAAMLAPVFGEDQLLVILACVRRAGEPVFDEEDLWFLTEVASHASAALTKATTYRRQSRIAESLQRSLIPASPSLDCMDLATYYSPASGEAEVGGDFLDIIHFDGCRVGVVVGDVSGKGMEAAIHTAEAKYMLRGFANQNPDPAFVLTELNKALYAFTPDEIFVTLFYGLVHIAAREMTYANAGHEPPVLLCSETGGLTELKLSGPILGVVKDYPYEASAIPLGPSQMLFCYTDGVTELPSNGERFGYGRLHDALRKGSCEHAQGLLDHMVGIVQAFGQRNQPDDQIMMVVSPKA